MFQSINSHISHIGIRYLGKLWYNVATNNTINDIKISRYSTTFYQLGTYLHNYNMWFASRLVPI